jgi:hypothetical protein
MRGADEGGDGGTGAKTADGEGAGRPDRHRRDGRREGRKTGGKHPGPTRAGPDAGCRRTYRSRVPLRDRPG